MNDNTDDDLQVTPIPRRDAVTGLSLLGLLATAFLGSLAYRIAGPSSAPDVLPTPTVVISPGEIHAGQLANSSSDAGDETVTAESLFEAEEFKRDFSVAPATYGAPQSPQ